MAAKTWHEVLDLAETYLGQRGVPDPRVAAELLAARLLKTGRGFLAPHAETAVAERHLEAMRRAMARLVAGEPLQYVLGEWDFRTLTLTCDKRALIPRPETEELVTRVLAHLKRTTVTTGTEGTSGTAGTTGGPLVIDVGTGSGCIILALAKEYAGPARFLGLDLSPDAIALAKENALRCGLSDRVTFAVADGLDDFDEPGCVDVIVSNPPYVTTADCATLDRRVREHEPISALDGGADGLAFYERFIGDAMNLLKPGGAVFFEIGEAQGSAVRKLLFDAGFDDIRIETDFAGHDRYASGSLP